MAFPLKGPILALSGSPRAKAAVSTFPLTKAVVDRFVAGETLPQVVDAVIELRRAGLQVTIDHLGEYTDSPTAANATVTAYLRLLDALAEAGLAAGSEVSVKLSAVGLSLPGGEEVAGAAVRRIADAAYGLGARVNVDMEDHTTVSATLRILAEARSAHPDVAVAVQAMLHRSEQDLATLTGAGSRVRLVKGAYQEPSDVAYQSRAEIDRAYVRGLRILMAGSGYPMVASHDPRMIAIAESLATGAGRAADTWEHQMLFGIRTDEQTRLVAAGRTVRVYVPYGIDWYGYFTRRLAERPANLLFFLRALTGRRSAAGTAQSAPTAV